MATPDTALLRARQPARRALEDALHAAAQGRGRLVLVTGEAGIGKTTLLDNALADAAGGWLVLRGQCWDGDGAPPFWPWVQVLRGALASGGDPGEAVVLLPESGRPPSGAAGDGPDGRFRLFDAVGRCLAALAARQPLAVLLDDLQWADEASLRLLEFVARHLVADRVACLGAFRDDEASEQLGQLLALGEQIVLFGLPANDVAAVMAAVSGTAPDQALVEDVRRRTGGNPFLVREVTRLLVAYGSAAPGALPAGVGVLGGVRDVLERRLARLSQACVELLGIAAIAGPEISVEVLGCVAAAPDHVPLLLEEAVAGRVLLPPASPSRSYRFVHDLFRETVAAGLAPTRRQQLHEAIGRALEARMADGTAVHAAELAAHFCAAGQATAPEAVHYSMLAAEDAAGRLAFEEACAHYGHALAARAQADAASRLELLVRLGDTAHLAGKPALSRDAYREAADLARGAGAVDALAAAAVGMHSLGWRESHAASIALLEEAAAALASERSSARARVLASLARDLHHSMREQDWQRAPRLAEEAVAVARQLGDPSTLAFCLLALHDARWRPGSAADRLPIVEEMLGVAGAAGNPALAAEAQLLRATALLELGRPEAIRELEGYCEAADALGQPRGRYGARSRRATLALIAGRPDEAHRLSDEALALGESIGEADAAGVHETLQWAAHWVADTRPDIGLASDPWPGLPLAAAIVALAAGDTSTAGELVAAIRLDALPRTHDLELAAFLTAALVPMGTDEQREQLLELLAPHAGGHVVVGGCASYMGAVDHHLASLESSLGRIDRARQRFLAAAELHDRLGAPAWAARSRRQLAALGVAPPGPSGDGEGLLRRDGDVWTMTYNGSTILIPDAKGLRDLAVLLSRPKQEVHAIELQTGNPPHRSAEPVLDERAKAAYRRRLAAIEAEIDEADDNHDPHRAELARQERDALVAELRAAVGLGGRDRRLDDERERARKAVTARIRDVIDRVARLDAALGGHLRASVRTGTWCCYDPPEPVRWRG